MEFSKHERRQPLLCASQAKDRHCSESTLKYQVIHVSNAVQLHWAEYLKLTGLEETKFKAQHQHREGSKPRGACAVLCPWSTGDGWWQHKWLCSVTFELHFRFTLVPVDQNHSPRKHTRPPETLILFYLRTNPVWYSQTISQNAREHRNERKFDLN